MLEIKSPIFKKIIPNERARRATQVDMTWTCWAQPGRTLVALARVREPRSSAFNLNIPSRPHTTTTSLALVLVTHRILQIFDPSGFRLVSSRPYTVSSDLNVSSTAWAAFGCSFQRHSPRLCRTNPPPPPIEARTLSLTPAPLGQEGAPSEEQYRVTWRLPSPPTAATVLVAPSLRVSRNSSFPLLCLHALSLPRGPPFSRTPPLMRSLLLLRLYSLRPGRLPTRLQLPRPMFPHLHLPLSMTMSGAGYT